MSTSVRELKQISKEYAEAYGACFASLSNLTIPNVEHVALQLTLSAIGVAEQEKLCQHPSEN